MIKKLFSLFMLALLAIPLAWGEDVTWSHVFARNELSQNGGTATLSSISWSYTSATYLAFVATGNQVQSLGGTFYQIGSNKNPQTDGWSLITSGFSGVIKSVKVNAATGEEALLSVKVGNTLYGETQTLTNSSLQDFTFTGSSIGTLQITLAAVSKAMYIHSVEVTYEAGSTTSVGAPSISFGDFTAGNTSATVNITPGANATTTYFKVGENGTYATTNGTETVDLTEVASPFTVYAYSSDGTNNSAEVNAEFTLPALGVSINPPSYTGYEAQTVTITPSNFVGDYLITYTLDGGTTEEYSEPFQVSGVGTHQIVATILDDRAGGSEVTSSSTITIMEQPSGEHNTATYIFNTDEGLAALGIEKPASGDGATGTPISGNTYNVGNVSLTSTDGGTPTRVYNNGSATDLRVYKNGGSITLSVPPYCTITNISIAGSSLNNLSTGDNGYSVTNNNQTGTWTGNAYSVTFTASATANIQTITVTYLENEVENLYIVGQVNGLSDWSATKAVKMTYDGTKYTAKFYVTGEANSSLSNAEEGNYGGTFVFATKIGSWSDVNNNRYEPPFETNDQNYNKNWWLATSGATNSAQLYKHNHNNSFLIPAGLYEVEVAGDKSTFNLKTIKDLTPAINPAGGNVALNTTATVSISENFNTFISDCNAFEGTDNNVTVTVPEVKFTVNNEVVTDLSKEITLDAVGERTVTGKCALVSGNSEYAAKEASETYNVYAVYTATIASGITGGTVAFNQAGTQTTLNNLTEDYEVRVYVSPRTDYELTSLTYTVGGEEPVSFITNNTNDYYTFNMPAGNVTINATFTYIGTATLTNYILTNKLVPGAKYIIVCEDGNMAMSNTTGKSEIEIENHKTTISSDLGVDVFTLGGSNGAWTLKSGDNYLTTSSSGTSLTTSTSPATWNISFDANNKHASVYGGNTNNQRYIRAWGTTNFRAYQSESQNGTYNIQLYQEVVTLAQIEETNPTGEVTIADDLQVVAIVDKEIDENTTIQVAFARDFAESINPASCPGGAVDFMRDVVTNAADQQDGAWRQNNWVMLDFTEVATNQFGLLSENCVIKGGTLTGTYNNYTFSVKTGFEYEAGTAVGNYKPNVYSPANFYGDHTQLGPFVDGEQVTYWFMTPKPMEVCTFTYAMYYYDPDPDNGYPEGFYMQEGDEYALKGGVGLDMTYNNADPQPTLVNGASYRFTGVIMKTESGKKDDPDPTNPNTHHPQDHAFNSSYKVAATNLGGDGSAVITAVNEVKSGGEVVSVTYCDLAGRMSQKPFAGVNIIVTRYSDGTVKTTKAIK